MRNDMTRLGDLCEFRYGKSLPEPTRRPGHVPVYGSNGIVGTHDEALTASEAIIIGRKGSVGEVHLSKQGCWPIDTTYYIDRSASDVDLNWLSRALRSLHLANLNKAAAVPGLNRSDAYDQKLFVPRVDEQRRIAAILDKADALRRKRKRALDLLESLAAATFRDAFEDASMWNDVRPLAELADVSSGITKGRKLNDTPTRAIAYMAVSNVQEKRLDLSTIKTIEATEEEISRYRLRKDDLLLTEGGDPDKLGRGTLWKDDILEAIHQNHIFRVRVRSSDLIPMYLNWLVGSPFGKAYFMRSAKQTTGIASINKQQLSALPVPVPSLVSQHAFVHSLSKLEILSEKASRSGAEISTLFASLQHRAFSGQL